MKILLVNPSITVYGKDATTPQVRPPLGLLYIAAACEREGHHVQLLDCIADSLTSREQTSDNGTRFGLSPVKVKQVAEEFEPDVVGISAMFTAFSRDAHDAAQAVKEWNPEAPVVFGGIHASTLPEEVLNDRFVDYIVLGEGDETFVELISALHTHNPPPHTVNGVVFSDHNAEIVFTPPRDRIRDLDSLPFPSRDLIDLKFYSKVAEDEADNYIMKHPYTTVSTSRGCPKRCVYCAAHNVWKHKWIPRSAENVLDEIEYLVDTYGIKEIHFIDDNTSIDRRRFAAICQGIIDRKLDISWACPTGLAIWTLDRQMLKLMKLSGCYKVCFGIETGHPDTQRFIKKNLDLDRTKQVIQDASDLGLWIQTTFIIGFPYETKEEIESTIDYAVSTYSDFVNFLLLIPYPGTEVFELMKKEELIPEQSWNYKNFGYILSGFRTLCRNKHFSAEELNEFFNSAFKKLLRNRIRRAILHPSILLKKIYNAESTFFFFRILMNFFGVVKVIFLQDVTDAGTLKPGYTEKTVYQIKN